ncbi:hypothetical protein LEP1GSC137_0201 [Leptospira borgpetersenii str. Noumea 25]|uniref:Uncharacterized protein n=4 Tax=Leptospira borgpetersenii TaxID=174 RepID=M3GB43_LEPBO|nr:hypothetical protein LBBP_04156 [Leptospira borgpetersenii serovar Ballum]EKP11867.1 hypothetical protein LEP1GSC128_1208 [Leptospira borgpetersenii str. 200801926]EKR01237.1 hypothetical protein LEP1GSC121_1503 [Leptospira borgpetersenii serovar Castellonis str. 200801910]EMF98126.1 hypothetical protein LEP1GSC123_1091 [Leptospira borgpetersenii str. 200701203]EMK11386.1 hypothetical protein LEP1GSC066_2722 [Leptospira sp. serovar Kenya str. Sh9]EMN14756.1 hypothetical protein LEP1GSC055_2
MSSVEENENEFFIGRPENGDPSYKFDLRIYIFEFYRDALKV